MTETYSAVEKSFPEPYPSWAKHILPMQPTLAFHFHIKEEKEAKKH